MIDNIRQAREDINKTSNNSRGLESRSLLSGITENITMKPVSKFRNHLESQYLRSLDNNSEIVDDKFSKFGKASAVLQTQGSRQHLNPFGPPSRSSNVNSDKKSSPS